MNIKHYDNPFHNEPKEATAVIHGDIMLDRLLEDQKITKEHSVDVYVNGSLVPKFHWQNMLVEHGDEVEVRQLVAGGDDSDPGRVLLTLAVVALALAVPAAAAAVAGAGPGAFGISKGIITATQLAIYVGGEALINSLYAPSLPRALPNPSPNFQITGARNQGRPGAPLPLLVGKHRFTPDYGAGPYTYSRADESFFDAIFNYGYGDLRFEDVRIGRTSLSNYQNVRTQYNDSNFEITLVAGDVVPQDVAVELEPSTDVIRTTAANTKRVEIDLDGTLFRSNDDGDILSNNLTFRVEYREVGDTTWLPFFDSDTTDLNQYTDGQIAAGWGPNEPGANGTYNYSSYQVSNADVDPVLRSFAKEFDTPGEFEIKITRTTAEFTDNRQRGSMTWRTLKSFQPDEADYEEQNRFAVSMKASGQLNGVIDELNALVYAKHPYFDIGDDEWKTDRSDWIETSNPASIFVYLALGLRNSAGELLFGLGFEPSQLDLDRLADWWAWCDTNELTCNYIFDTEISMVEALNLVARCGRASLSLQTGKLGVVFDQENKPVVQTFGMSNILKDSFGVEYITEKLADQITVQFRNEEQDYQLDSVTVDVDPSATALNPVTIEIEGLTNKEMAFKEANLIAARQFYNRRRIYFETDLEGFICERGDVIQINHNMTDWGTSGRLAGYNNATNTMTLDRDVTFEVGETYYVRVRAPDGTLDLVEAVNPATVSDVTTDTVELDTALAFNPAADTENAIYDYLWFFDYRESAGFKAKIVSMEPVSENSIRIAAIDEVAEYYDSQTNPVDYTPPENSARFDPPAIENVTITEQWQGRNLPIKIILRWTNDNAQGARIRYSRNLGGKWVDFGIQLSNSFEFELIDWVDGETLYFELVPFALASTNANQASPVTSFQYTIEGIPELADRINVPVVQGLEVFENGNNNEFSGSDAKFTWKKTRAIQNNTVVGPIIDPTELDAFFKDYYVTIRNTDGTIRRQESVKDEFYVYTLEKNKEDAVELGEDYPVREFLIEVIMRTSVGAESPRPATLQVSNPAPATPQNITAKASFSTLTVQADPPTDIDFTPNGGMIVWLEQTSSNFTEDDTNKVYEGPGSSVTLNTLPFNGSLDYRVKVAFYDGFDLSGLNVSGAIAVDVGDVEPAGIERGTTLPSLPNANYPVGAYFVLLDDPNPGDVVLKRNVGNVWVEGADTDDIAVNAIVAAKIAAGAVTTDKLDANSVTAAKIAANTITANEIAAGTITGNEIAANTITAANIAAGSITATELNVSTINLSDLSGSLDFSDVSGPTKPDDNATNNGASISSVGDLVGGMVLSGSGLIRAGKTSFADNANAGFIMEFNGGTPRFKFGGGTGDQISWNGSVLNIRGTLTADDITTGTLSTNRLDIDGINLVNNGGVLEIGTGGVNTDELANDAVTTVKIDDLNVTTLKIAGEAVTQTEYAERTTNLTLTNTLGTVTEITGIVVPTIGPLGTETTRVLVTWSALVNSDTSGPPDVQWRVRRIRTSPSGSPTATIFDETIPAGFKGASWSYPVDDDVLPGTYTYRLEGRTAFNRTLYRAAIETVFAKK